MNKSELLRMALLNLKRRKTRTILAVMGVIIGTCAIVVMLSLGLGLSHTYTEQIKNMGNIHMVTLYSGGGGRYGVPTDPKDKDKGKITEKTLTDIKKMRGVKAVTPMEQLYGRVMVGRYGAEINIVGVDPAAMEDFGYKVTAGRGFQLGDKDVLLFGGMTPDWFWDGRTNQPPPRDPEGKVQINLLSDKVIFTQDLEYMKKKGHGMGGQGGSDRDRPKYELHKMRGIGLLENSNDRSGYSVFTTLEAMKKIKESARRAEKDAGQSGGYQRDIKKDGYEQAMIYVEDINEVENVVKILKDKGFMTESLIDILNEVKKTAGIIQAVLGGIGAVSLLVAALGITNTMIMSIYERTREIGVMKVLGAKLRDIRDLFLIEAALIGFFGGLVGNILSLLLSFGVNTLMSTYGGGMLGMGMGMEGESKLSLIPWWLLLASLTFAIAIGIISGYYPAKRAMNLSALESLRNE